MVAKLSILDVCEVPGYTSISRNNSTCHILSICFCFFFPIYLKDLHIFKCLKLNDFKENHEILFLRNYLSSYEGLKSYKIMFQFFGHYGLMFHREIKSLPTSY